MDDIWQGFNSSTSYALAIALTAVLVLYLVIRLAVMHALRDHARWLEKERLKATRSTYPAAQEFPPITPESHVPF